MCKHSVNLIKLECNAKKIKMQTFAFEGVFVLSGAFAFSDTQAQHEWLTKYCDGRLRINAVKAVLLTLQTE
jgi:hypothetical protein